MIEGEWLTLPRSVSVAQTCPVKGDVTANVAEHLRLIAIAKAEGAQVVVFPELSLTGYEIELASELAFSEHDSRLAPLAEVASSRTITLIVGAPVRIEARLHIAAFVFLPDGTQTLYTKHRLGAFDERARADGSVPPAEKTVFEPGDRNPLVRIGGNTAAVAICADIGLPTHPRRAADRGVKAYLASMFVIPSAFNADSGTLCRYATQHSMVVALSNFGGPTGGLAAAGRSSIWSQKGDRLVELGPTGAGVAVATETSDGWHAKIVMLDKP